MAAWGNMYLMLMLSSFRYAVDTHSSSRSNNGRGNISSMHALPCPSLSSHTVRLPVQMQYMQKRGLPHCHILLILSPEDRLKDPEDIDTAVCAELPPVDCKLRRTVLNCMVHRDCSNDPEAPCRKGGGCCSKKCV